MVDLPLCLVVDASVLVSELLRASGRVRLAHHAFQLYLAEYVWDEVQDELPKRAAQVAERRGFTSAQGERMLDAGLVAIEDRIAIIPDPIYRALEDEARWRIARDQRDWPTVALALALDAGIWTEDGDFLGCGVATWNTGTLTRLLAIIDADGK